MSQYGQGWAGLYRAEERRKARRMRVALYLLAVAVFVVLAIVAGHLGGI